MIFRKFSACDSPQSVGGTITETGIQSNSDANTWIVGADVYNNHAIVDLQAVYMLAQVRVSLSTSGTTNTLFTLASDDSADGEFEVYRTESGE